MENLCNGLWHGCSSNGVQSSYRLRPMKHSKESKARADRHKQQTDTHKAHTWCVHVHKKCINFERHQHVLHTHTHTWFLSWIVAACLAFVSACDVSQMQQLPQVEWNVKKNVTFAFYDCDWLPRPLCRQFGKTTGVKESEWERERGRDWQHWQHATRSGHPAEAKVAKRFRNAAEKGLYLQASEGVQRGGGGSAWARPLYNNILI